MVAPVGKLVDRDLGYKRIKRDFKRASRGPFRVDVGLIEGGAAAAKHPKSNLTIGEVGSLHEFFVLFLGDRKRSQIIRRINAGIPPPLDASTVTRKGHSTPLVDTGSLVGAIEVDIGK